MRFLTFNAKKPGKWLPAAAFLVFLLALPAGAAPPQETPEREDREKDPLVLANLEGFQDLKFGLFIHWNPCSQWGARIAWPLARDAHWARPDDLPAWRERNRDFDRFCRDFFALNRTFHPRHFDPDRWAEAAAAAGMKYLVFVTKCHDGFAMFRTGLSDYCITHPSCPFHADPRADVTRRVLDAFRKRGLKVGVYFSMPDWHHPDYEDPGRPVVRSFRPNYDIAEHPEKWRRYLAFMHGQVRELMSGYGKIDILWLDGGAGKGWGMDRLAAMARSRQPGILIVHRGAGGRYENYRTPEQQIPARALPYPWETCLTMGDYWAYNPKDYYKPARELIHLLAEITCKGGNLLLDIGPDAEGRFPPESKARLRELGEWMASNGEAIHGTRPLAPYRQGRICLTRKGRTVYLIYLAKLAQVRPPRTMVVFGIRPAPGSRVTLLGRNLALPWENTKDGMAVHIPAFISCPLRGEHPYCRHAWTVKIDQAVFPSEPPAKCRERPERTLSNGVVQVRVDPEKGSFDVIDLRRRELVIRAARDRVRDRPLRGPGPGGRKGGRDGSADRRVRRPGLLQPGRRIRFPDLPEGRGGRIGNRFRPRTGLLIGRPRHVLHEPGPEAGAPAGDHRPGRPLRTGPGGRGPPGGHGDERLAQLPDRPASGGGGEQPPLLSA